MRDATHAMGDALYEPGEATPSAILEGRRPQARWRNDLIVRPKPSLWGLFSIIRLSILPRIASQLVCVFVFSAMVVWFELRYPNVLRSWTVAPFTLLGIALSIFLGFRNNACYERWWEARKSLGALIGEMRSWARLMVTLPAKDEGRRVRMVRMAIAFQYALTAHLRGTVMPVEVAQYAEGFVASTKNAPDELLRMMAKETAAMLRDGEIGEQVYRLCDDRLTAFVMAQVQCERIRSTPTPFAYTLLLHRTAYAYCFLLPLGLAATLGWGTPLFCTIVAYAFFGLDALGDELEEPFGTSINALPLDAMTRTVEISLLEALGATELPEPLLPVDYLLR